jgi:hypothetical protein
MLSRRVIKNGMAVLRKSSPGKSSKVLSFIQSSGELSLAYVPVITKAPQSYNPSFARKRVSKSGAVPVSSPSSARPIRKLPGRKIGIYKSAGLAQRLGTPSRQLVAVVHFLPRAKQTP